MDNKTIFQDFAKAFEAKIDKDYSIKLQFEIYDQDNEIWQIDVNNGNISIHNEKRIVPEETFVLSKHTLMKLYNNEIAPLTALAQEPDKNGEMRALIDVKNKTNDKKIYYDKKISNETLNFIERLNKFNNFFSKDYPTKIIVNKKNSLKLHNVKGIGLLSKFIGGKRVLHAYFSIKKDEVLYEPGFEFSIYVLSGKGIISIEDEEYEIEPKNYYHMNPKNKIYIKNKEDEPLEILYLSNA